MCTGARESPVLPGRNAIECAARTRPALARGMDPQRKRLPGQQSDARRPEFSLQWLNQVRQYVCEYHKLRRTEWLLDFLMAFAAG